MPHNRTLKQLLIKITTLFVILFALALSFGITATKIFTASAAPGTGIITYQGRVLNANGVPVSDASLTMIFRLYDADTGGNCVWSNSSATCASATGRSVTLTDGLFSEDLGDTDDSYASLEGIFEANGTLYLDVTIAGETLTPRKQITSAPYAMRASSVIGNYLRVSHDGVTAAAAGLFRNLTGAEQPALEVEIESAGPAINVFGFPANAPLITAASTGVQPVLYIDKNANTGTTVDDTAGGALHISNTGNNDYGLTVYSNKNGDATSPLVYLFADNAAFSQPVLSLRNDGENSTLYILSNGTTPTAAAYIQQHSNTNALLINQQGNSGAAGALEISNTTNPGSAFVIYSDMNASAANALVHFTADNSAFDQHVLSLTNDGVGSSIYIDANGSTGSTVNDTLGGALHISNTGNANYGLTVYSDIGIPGASPLAYLFADNASFFRNVLQVRNDGTGSSIFVDADGSTGAIVDDTLGGALHVTNTGNSGTGLSVYSNHASGISMPLVYFYADNAAYDSRVLHITNDGVNASLYIDANGNTGGTLNDAAGGALHISNTGNTDSAFTIYSNMGASASSPLAFLHADNAAFDQSLLSLRNDGGGNLPSFLLRQSTLSGGPAAFVIQIDEAASGNDVISIYSSMSTTPDVEFRFENDGDAFADGAWNGSGADYAEFFETVDSALHNDHVVVCRDRTRANSVKRCEAGNTDVIGVISNDPSFVANNGDAGQSRIDDPNYALVGLVGQIQTQATAAGGAIAVGDPVTASGTAAGYAAKANGAGQIIGFALEPLASGTGVINVYVNTQWYTGGGNFVLAPESAATVGTPAKASPALMMRGLAWDGSSSVARNITVQTDITTTSDYRLSVKNHDDAEVAFVNNQGDLAVAGRIYPSDRGTLQTEKYIYYDGSGGPGGDMMRTNASGWGTGSYDFAEMFPSNDVLGAGEVVIFASNKESVARSNGATYDQKIAGVISTRPGFLAGENKPGHVPVALAGRVPTKVSNENGVIAVGDPLTTSSTPGVAMKATQAGQIIGYAMEAFGGQNGSIIVFIRPSYFSGNTQLAGSENSASGAENLGSLNLSGGLNMAGSSITNISSIAGIGSRWFISEDGNFFTEGAIGQIVNSYQGEKVTTYATMGRERTIQLSGTAKLMQGTAIIEFESIDPKFNDIISNNYPYRVFLTPHTSTGTLSAINRTNNGFMIHEAGSTTTDVDWLVIAYHKDVVLDEVLQTPEVTSIPPVNPIEEPVVVEDEEEEVSEVVEEESVEEPVTEEPTVEEPIVEEPVQETPQEEQYDEASDVPNVVE